LIKDDIMAFQSGKRDAFASVLSEYEPLIESQISGLYGNVFSESDNDDLRQEATIALYSAACSYDTDQDKITFGLYAKICLRNALITQLRKLQKQKKSLSLEEEDETLFAIFDSGANPSEELVDRETVESMNKKIKGALSPFEVKVWQMYLTGNSTKNISTVLGKSEKSIENAIFRLRRKLRDLFKADF